MRFCPWGDGWRAVSFLVVAGSFFCSEVWCVPAGLFGAVPMPVGSGGDDLVGALSDPGGEVDDGLFYVHGRVWS